MSSSFSEIDWIPKKIYLLEKTVNRIDVFTLNGENRTNLITSDINTPTAVVRDPNEGFINANFIKSTSSKATSSGVSKK